MKKMSVGKRLLALLLVLAMVFGMAACGAPAKEPEEKESAMEGDLSREDQELIVELLGDGEDPSKMTDDELNAYVDKIIGNNDPAELVNLSNKEQEKTPELDMEGNRDAYDSNGAMTKPFDQVYPEVIEKEEVTFSGESILIKLASDKLTDGLKTAGVGALKEIVPLEGASWYEAMLVEGTEADAALEAVRALPETLLAEYNYEIKTAALDDYKHFDDKTDEEFKKNGHNKEQWHQHYCGIPDGYEEMETEGGDPSVVVAVIDSGVDYDHEDLKDNMWFNTKEIPDNGIDDDGNGYVDDYYGIDLIAGKGSADDDNGHGTHVAGIIAGRNNNTGIVGIAYNVKIMPIKAAMHNGTLNQADIAEAILYAYEMGAEVINMSFGGAACSIAVQDALATAYNRCVLVASAGNSGYPNQTTDYMSSLPNYPAALSYVLGVMSVDENGVESSFSNWDVFPFNGVEYEVYAPGENIMSTLPNDQYGYLSGTSMAAPIVSSFAAILRSEFSDRDKYPTKFIYGQLSSTSDYYANCIDPMMHKVNGRLHNLPQIVNLDAALTKLPKPEVNVNDYVMFDSTDLSPNNNGDGVIDAGETIALGLTLRNRWGMSENTLVTIDTLVNGIEDPYITIVNPTVDYGSVGTYSTGDCGKLYTNNLHTGWENPFIIKIAEDCPNDYRFTLNVNINSENALDEADETVYQSGTTIDGTVRAGRILPSVIEEDMVLTADSLYIIPNATVIQKGVTVRVEPGTHIQFWSDDAKDPYASNYIAYLLVNGNFLVEGTKENPVYIYPSQLMDRYGVEISASNSGYVSMKYADITNFFYCNGSTGNHTGTGNKVNLADHCTFRMNYDIGMRFRYLSSGTVQDTSTGNIYVGNLTARDCVFYKLASFGSSIGYPNTNEKPTLNGSAKRCIFVDCAMRLAVSATDCVFLGNNAENYNGRYIASAKEMPTVTTSFPAQSKLKIYYHEETGTTYIAALDTAITPYLLEQLGGSFAVPQSEEELKLILDKVVYPNNTVRNNFGIYYDGTQYVWSDGTVIAEYADPTGLTKTNYNGNTYWFSSGKLVNNGSYSSTAYIYEIPGEVYPWTVDFAETDVTLDLRTAYQLNPVSTPIQPARNEYIYQSTNKSVVTVSQDGLVTPVGIGDADVIVYTQDQGVYNHVTFHILPREIRLKETETTLYYRDTYQIAPPVAYPVHQENETFVYTSSDEKVATVTETGFVTATGAGTATITVAAADGLASNTITITVLPREVAVEKANIFVYMEHSDKIVPSLLPTQYTDDRFTYTSSDESIVKVDENGVITPVSVGTAEITISGGDHTIPKTVAVMVMPFYALESISFGETAVELAAGKSLQTTLVLAPENASAYQVSYASDNENAVIVNADGMITAVGSGVANITVSYQGKTATMQVTAYVEATSIKIPSGNITIGREYMTMDFPEVTAANGGEPRVVWSTADTTIAEVADGKVQLKAAGTTTLTATDLRSGHTATVKLTVTQTAPKVNSIYVNYEAMQCPMPEVVLAPGVAAEPQWSFPEEYGGSSKLVDIVDGMFIFKQPGSFPMNVTDPRTGLSTRIWIYLNATAPKFARTADSYDLSVGTVELPEVTFAKGVAFQPEITVADTSVAVLEDGKLKLLSAGITSVCAYDPRNNLVDNYYIRVTDGEVPVVVDIDTAYRDSKYNGSWGDLAVVTYDNGEVYTTDGSNGPYLMATNVQAVEICYSGYGGRTYGLVCYKDGTLEIWQINTDNSYCMETYTQLQGMAIKDIAFSVQKLEDDPMYTHEDEKFSCFALLEDGTCYAWGDGNDYGQLGTGDRWAHSEPTAIGYDIQEVVSGQTVTYFRNPYNVIYSGGEDIKMTQQYYLSIDCDEMVDVVPGTEILMYWNEDSNSYGSCIPGDSYVVDYELEEYPHFDMVDFSYSVEYGSANAVGLKDGKLYSFDAYYDSYYERWEFGNIREFEDISDAVLAACWSHSGAVYVCDSGFAKSTSNRNRLFPLPIDQEYVELLSTNLSEDGVLREDELILRLNKAVANVWGKFYVDDVYTGVYWPIRGNCVAVEMTDGFAEGVTYRVVIDKGSLVGMFGNRNVESYEFTFTWQPAETEMVEPAMMASRKLAAGQEVFPTLSENHTTVVNANVQRYHTAASFVQALKDVQKQTQYNPNFFGNAILNPVSTDTNVEHWFRLQAPSVSSGTYTEIPLGSNYWGTTDTRAIELQMIDYTDFISYARLMYAPYLEEAPENTFPFVTAVKLLNKHGEEVTTVGNEQITFRITFNRDMDTTIPLQVRFGSAAPYGDYQVEGKYVDARTWEGTYTLNTVIENGNQFFSIANGCSATDDLALQPDVARFGFVIDTTAAQALTMQGTATDSGVELRWTQDDFDTLMGYNVYRSNKEDGLYTRINKTVIPANTMTFFDDTVEPGKVYYYNFTVLKTDLTESEPSGKISIMSKDTMAPNIYHSPVSGAFTGANLVLSATVTDNLNIAYANLYYRIAGTEGWNIVRMNNLNDKYSAIIPAQYVTVAGVEYYIEAFDGVSFTYKGTADAPYFIAVQEAVEANALGDVDGDGVITNLDAVLLLYAINDKYNLTPEEFARADLNGDGELWAAEALRILQYVSGTVGSVKM